MLNEVEAMVPVFQRLTQVRPWYSRYGEGLFKPTTYGTTLGSATNIIGSVAGSGDWPPIQSHLLGLRHYELVNHLGNVQATVLDRVTPVVMAREEDPVFSPGGGGHTPPNTSPSPSQVLVGYRADVSSAQDYYPFGMLMPGRYVTDTGQKCVQVSQTVMVKKPWDVVIGPGRMTQGGPSPVLAFRHGGSSTVPAVGSLAVADSFKNEVLYLYHYVDSQEKPNKWVLRPVVSG